MKTAIIIWNKDPAGMNVKNNLIKHFNLKKTSKTYDNETIYKLDENTRLYTINEQHIYADNLDKKINADVFIFATTHRSEAGKPSLSVHTPGNWNKAELGGKERKLCIAMPLLMKNAYLELKKLNHLKEFEVTLECTHHGPYIEKPSMFIEIGSSLQQWENKQAGKINANVIVNIIKKQNNYKIAFGIGGPHYCNNFNKILERTDIATSHICPKYMLQYLDEEMIKQAIQKSSQKVDLILLDWKGLGTEKTRIVELLDKLNIKYERVNNILE